MTGNEVNLNRLATEISKAVNVLLSTFITITLPGP